MIRTNDQVGYDGAIYALQSQGGSSLHPGGRTALSFHGKSHYLDIGQAQVFLFGDAKETLPKWFKNHQWGAKMIYYPSSFLPPHIGLTDVERKDFSIKVSSPARAMMECLYLAPKHQSLMECLELMEGLNNLRPNLVQELLDQCRSVKVKRLFLYLAEKAGHSWFKYVQTENIDLGKGKRSLVKNGTFIAKYQITVPKELEDNGNPEI